MIDLASGLTSGFSTGFAAVGGVVGVRFSSASGLVGAVVVRPGFPGVVEGGVPGVPFCCRFDFSSRRFGFPVCGGVMFTPLAFGLVVPGVVVPGVFVPGIVVVGAVAAFGAGGVVPLPGTGSAFCGLSGCCGVVPLPGAGSAFCGGNFCCDNGCRGAVVPDGAFAGVVGGVPGFAVGLIDRLGGGGALPC